MAKHLTGISDLSLDDISYILDRAQFYSNNFKANNFPRLLDSIFVANIFYENSTRTRFSFEVAEKSLGAHVLNFSKSDSSVAKGEGLYDTLKTFESLQTQIAVIRHSDDHFIEQLKDKIDLSIINAGAGKFEHPSQALLDLFTMKQEFGDLAGLKVGICGDVATSRVASSHIRIMEKLKMIPVLTGPSMLLPSRESLPAHCQVMDLESAIKQCDVMMFLRIQHERHETFEIDIAKYNHNYGLNLGRINLMPKHSIVMHPGPFNRGIEITDEVVEHNKSRIFKQMENGVYTRMAILDWILQ